jgi:hypothetical protein
MYIPVVAEIRLLEILNVERVLIPVRVHGAPIGGIQQERVLIPQHLKENMMFEIQYLCLENF